MANSYAGPSRLDLLVLIHNYNIIEDHKAKIAISETITDPDELVLFQARTARLKKPKNQVQKDIDNSIKQLWSFKKHVDGFKELRAKDWERIVWATNTLRFLVPYCRGKSMEVAANAKVKTEQANKTVAKLELKGASGMRKEQPSHSAVNHNVAASNLKQRPKSDIQPARSSKDAELNAAPTLKEQPAKAEEECRPAKPNSVARKDSVTFTKETKAQIKEQATLNSGEKPKEKEKLKDTLKDEPDEKLGEKPKSKEKTCRKAAKDIDKLKSRSTPNVQEQKAAEAYEAARKLASEIRKF